MTTLLPDDLEPEWLPLEQIAALMADLPLFSDLSPEARRTIARWARVVNFGPGIEIIRQDGPGESHNWLYVVLEGELRQFGTAPDGNDWLERTLRRGDAFGRYSVLFDRPFETTVRSETFGRLLLLRAEHVSLMLQRWPDLLQKLIPEERIHRLRAMPLYSALPDFHIRRLADHIVEKHLKPGEILAPAADAEPHVWVIAEGQVVLAPVDARRVPTLREAEPGALATVGHPFVDGDIPETRLTPRKARAVGDVVLYGLPASKFQALLERFEAPGEHYGREILAFLRVPDIPAYLRGVDELAKHLPDSWLNYLRGFVAWVFTPARQTVLRQGERGEALYILTEGEAILRAVDEQGRRRPRSYLFPRGYVGRRALLRGTEHDVTVEATRRSYWLRLSRQDLDRFSRFMEMKEAPRWRRLFRLWAETVGRLQAAAQGRPFDPCRMAWCNVWERVGGVPPQKEAWRRRYRWQQPDEKILWQDRAHVLFFFSRAVPILAVFSLLFAIAIVYGAQPIPAALRGLLFALVVFTAATLFYVIVDYYNDFYALTDRRVVHRDRVVLVRETWDEIPLDRVQDAILQQDLQGRILGYGTVIVQSAAEGGSIRMERIPRPRWVQERILAERGRARSRRRAWRREHLRAELQRRLFEVLLASWPQVATGKTYVVGPAVPPVQKKPAQPRKARGWLAGIGRVLGMQPAGNPGTGKYPLPWWPVTHWRDGKTVYWRKHPLNLIRRIMAPLAFLALLVTLFLVVAVFLGPMLGIALNLPVLMAFGALFIAALGWFIWQYDDWRNDLYVLTETQLVDIDKKPFFFREERRVAPLGQVQNVQFVMPGILSQLLNYGDVVIKTAAAGGDLTFEFVPDPRGVTREIQRYLTEFRRRQEEREFERQQRLLAEGLEIYNELTGFSPPGAGRGWHRTD